MSFEEAWEQAIALLPPTSYIDEFFLAYRPWLDDKTHRYYAHFKMLQKPNRPFRAPNWINGYGSTPLDALSDFISKWSDYL